MIESLIGNEILPNIHIETISHQKTGNTHYFVVKMLMFDVFEKGWSNKQRFTQYLKTKVVISNSEDLSSSLINGEINLHSEKLKAVFMQTLNFSQFKYEKTTYKGIDLKKYSCEIKLNINDEKNTYDRHSQVFVSNFIDMKQKTKEKNLLFARNKTNYIGSMKSEVVFPKKDLCYAFVDDDNNIWTGPTHVHENVVMAGSQHTDEPHKTLRRIQFKRSKILYGTEPKMSIDVPSRPRKNPKPRIPRVKKRKFVMQKEFSEDHDRNLTNVAIINLEQILLQESLYARIIDSKTPEILENISKNLNIGNIELSRYRNKDRKNKRKSLYFYRPITIDETSKFVIAKASNAKKFIEKKVFFETPKKKNISVSPTRIQLNRPNKVYDGKKITRSLVKDSLKVGEIEQLNLTLPDHFRAISFTDFSIKRSKSGTYSYKIKLSFKDEAYLYCKNILRDLMRYSAKISNLYTTLIMKNVFKEGQFSRVFLQEFYSQYDVAYNPNNNRISGEFNTPSLKNSYLYKAFETLLIAERLLNLRIKSDEHIENLNLFSSNLEKINSTIEYYNKIINIFKRTFKLNDGNNTAKTAGKVLKDRSLIDVTLNLPKKYERKLLMPIGINFISNNKFNGVPKMNLSFLVNRGDREVNKFFAGNINTNSDSLSFLTTDFKKNFANLKKDKMKFFSPSKFFVGNKEVDTSEINPNSFDSDFFNSIRTIVSSIESGETEEQQEDFMEESDIDHLIDSREFLGSDTKFNNIILSSIRLSKFEKVKKIRKKFRFLDNKIIKKMNKNISLKTFDLKQPDNFMTKKIESGQQVPMQLKALSLLNTPITNFDLDTIDFDPLSNPQTQETFQQNYLNLNKLIYLDGFEKVDGKFSLEKPIYKEIEPNNLAEISQKNVLAELVPVSMDNIIQNSTAMNIHDKNIFIENISTRQISEEMTPIVSPTFINTIIPTLLGTEVFPISINSLYDFEYSTVQQINQNENNNNFIQSELTTQTLGTQAAMPRATRSATPTNTQINRTISPTRSGY